MKTSSIFVCIVLTALVSDTLRRTSRAANDADPKIDFVQEDGRLSIKIDDKPVAVYCYEDEKTTRPYFAHVKTLSGMQVTRNNPPIAGQDIVDHDAIHPGIWMSFGDISGSDYWRNKAKVRQVNFTKLLQGGAGHGSFAVRNQYMKENDPTQVLCEEDAHYAVVVCEGGYLLRWDSTFSSKNEIKFGDQEEMGIGFRVATPLRVGASGPPSVPAGNGKITNSAGAKNEKEVWGNTAEWCDYSGTIDGQPVGMTILCHPDNFRPSWFHARDYGLLEANPFGRQAFGKGEKSSVTVRPGEKLRLRYGIFVHSGADPSIADLKARFEEYVQLAGR